MHIHKLTITSNYAPNVHMIKPQQNIAYNAIYQSVNDNWNRFSHEDLPRKIVKKLLKEKSIPSFINPACYIERSK